ncbi:MAG: energy transducer TonB [Rhizomicrobium sp.]
MSARSAALVAGLLFAAFMSAASADELRACYSEGVTRPVMQTTINLMDDYPPLSVALGEEGATDLSFVIKSNGTVSDVKVVRSSGSLRLDDASVEAAKQAIYSQPKLGNQPIACSHYLRINWKLEGQAGGGLWQSEIVVLTPPEALYPPGALAEHREGVTSMAVTLAKNGSLMKVAVMRSSGSDDLDAAAVAFAKTRSFKPGEVDGHPTGSVIGVTIPWTLPSDKNARPSQK